MEPRQGKMLDKKFACVLTLHRDDLISAGVPEKDAAGITDDTLEDIASRLGEAILDTSYWDCLNTIINENIVPIPYRWIFCAELPDETKQYLDAEGNLIPKEQAEKDCFVGTPEEADSEEYRRADLYFDKSGEITQTTSERIK